MNTELLDLRSASEADRRFCYQVKKAALRNYVEAIWGWDEQEQIDYHRRDWEAGKPEIITLNREDIGTIEIARSAEFLHLGEFYLVPEFQRQGIGTYFMRRVASEADENGLPVKLEVIKINPVKSLYLRFGFRTTGETKTHFLMEREPKKAAGTTAVNTAG